MRFGQAAQVLVCKGVQGNNGVSAAHGGFGHCTHAYAGDQNLHHALSSVKEEVYHSIPRGEAEIAECSPRLRVKSPYRQIPAAWRPLNQLLRDAVDALDIQDEIVGFK